MEPPTPRPPQERPPQEGAPQEGSGRERRLRFGVVISDASCWQHLRERALTAQRLGYSTLVMPDHLRKQLPPLVALSALAAVTDTIKLGTMVLATAIRDPVMTAREAAMVQMVSQGRLELGLGAGWLRSDFAATATPYSCPAALIAQFSDHLDIITRLLAGEALHQHHSTLGTIDDAYLWPPLQAPPRIVVGGGSPRVLALAAQRADDVSILPSLRSGQPGAHRSPQASLEAFARKCAWVRHHAGPRWAAMNLATQVFHLHIGRQSSHYLDQVARKLPLPRSDLAHSPMVLAGELDQVCDQLRTRHQHLGLNYTLINDHHMHDFAPVLERLG